MNDNDYFQEININKRWSESDWETYFQRQDSFRLSQEAQKAPSKKPLSKIRYEGTDEVAAFEPVRKLWGGGDETSNRVIDQIRTHPFLGDAHPESDYHPATNEDPHFWAEGAPLASLLIYRDACRFAIVVSLEIDRYIKRRGLADRKKFGSEYEALRFHANWVAINIAQGHKIGYGADRIRGNIAKALRALTHAETCITLLNRFSKRTQSRRIRDLLFSFAAQLRHALFMWIDDLRLRTR